MATSGIEVRMARLEGAYEQINARLEQIEQRFEHIEGRFNNLYTLLISMWVTMSLGILGTLLTIVFKA